MTTPLLRHLESLIARNGPISIADYMAIALSHPEHGYYMTRDPLGVAGDFITAPEVSQMFGELVGLWCVQTWRDNGAPRPFALVELGPGRGTLMSDLLRASQKVAPDFAEAARVHLVETSPALRARQRALLGEAAHWHAQFDSVPALPLLLIANEFFDALPVHQFVRTARGWCERYVGLVPGAEPPRLSFVMAPNPLPSDTIVPQSLRDSAMGTLFELRPAAETLIEAIAARIATREGIAALVIDYGYMARMAGDSLQALRAHKPQDPLKHPGEADLTAHVDFAALAEAARRGGACVCGPVTQGAFLTALGIAQRAERLAGEASETESADTRAALRRLTHQDAMGTLFKALALTRANAPALAGFES